MTQDFSNRNLQGWDFRNRDLTGANFSNANIQGANFVGATLRNANFVQVKAGLQSRHRRYLILLSLLLWLAVGLIAAASGAYGIERFTTHHFPTEILAGIISFTVFIRFFRVFAKDGVGTAFIFLVIATIIFIILAVGLARVGETAKVFSEMLAVSATETIATGTVTLLGSLSTILVKTILTENQAIFWRLLGVIIAFILSSVAAIADEGLRAGLIALWITILGILASLKITRHALDGAEQHTFLKNLVINFCIRYGTRFDHADLTDTDFTAAILKHTNFQNALLTRTCWYQAKQLDLAQLDNTYLKLTKIRNLLIDKRGEDQNFDEQNLRELNLSQANLKNASFIGANFYQANLQEANLSGTNLVRCQFEGADLTGTNLTGACIEDWLVTRSTKLNDLECKYVFLKFINGDKRDQIPPRGEFIGEGFILFIRSILDTIDLYHEQGINPKIAVSVLKSLSSDYQEFFNIVTLDRKDNGAIIMKLKTSEWIDQVQLKEDYYNRYNEFLTLSIKDPDKKLPFESREVSEKLYQEINAIQKIPTNHTYPMQLTIQNSDIRGDINLIQGNYNQLRTYQKTIDLRELTKIISNLELPFEIKEKIINILQEYQENNYSRND